MSAAGRGAERRARDAYFTPVPLARAIVARLAEVLPAPSSVLEPSAGAGAFMDAAATSWPTARVAGVDIEPRRTSIARGNFLSTECAPAECALVLGNPPYIEAEAFVRRALDVVAPGGHVAFLLRAGFLHGKKRGAWVQKHLRLYIPLAERPSFTDDGRTDASEYSVFVWRRDHDWPPMIAAPLFWRSPAPSDVLPLFAGRAL